MTEKIDNIIEATSRRLARGSSRRSFLGQLGVAGVSLAAGGAAAAVNAPVAEAVECTGTKSITCGHLTGSNQCPAGTCTCGYWYDNGPCGSSTIWADCCGGCNSGSDCRCILEEGIYRPTCCNTREWTQGCLSNENPHIKCRVYHC
jgi:hypothetical protein